MVTIPKRVSKRFRTNNSTEYVEVEQTDLDSKNRKDCSRVE